MAPALSSPSPTQLFLLSSLFLFAISVSTALEGTILSLRRFDGSLQAQSYPIPLSKGLVKHHPLTNNLSEFSLTCSSCDDGPGLLTFERGPDNVYVVLNRRSLSVFQINTSQEIDPKPTQVVELDSRCSPLHLMAFRYSPNEFAVVCTGLNVHLARLTTDHQVALGDLKFGPSEEGGVLVESDSQLIAVSYLGQHVIEKYSFHSALTETPDLPESIKCLGDDSIALYPLHGQEKFLLQCMTQDGLTLYIVPPSPEGTVRSIEAHGRPYSSLNGTYISMVNGSKVVSYSAANQNVQAYVEPFPGPISKFQFLGSHSALVQTEDGKHYLMDISRSQPTPLPGGLPILWVWIDPYGYYVYVTQDSKLYAFNGTSTEPLYKPVDLVNRPEMLLFVEKYIPATKPPDDSSPSSKEPGFIGNDPPKPHNPNLVAIIGGVICGVAVIAIVGVLLGLIGYQHSRRNRTKPIQAISRHEDPAVPLCDMTKRDTDESGTEESGREDGQTKETTFTLSITPLQTESRKDDPTAVTVATTTVFPSTQQQKEDGTGRDLAQVESSKQVVSPSRVPSVRIQTGKTVVKSLSPSSSPPAAAAPTLPAVRNHPGGPDFMQFQENPSYPRDTSTASSAFIKGEEETELLHVDVLAS
jgi:hypothetical protein